MNGRCVCPVWRRLSDYACPIPGVDQAFLIKVDQQFMLQKKVGTNYWLGDISDLKFPGKGAWEPEI